MMNMNNPSAPIFQSSPQIPIPNQQTNQPNTNNLTSSDPFEKLLNKSLNSNNSKISDSGNLERNLENYKKQIEQLDLEQLRMERKRLVDQIVKYMNEGKTDLLEETQKKYKIAIQVSDSKVMNFYEGAIAKNTKQQEQIAQSPQEDFLKKLQESEILPPDNSPAPSIPQQTQLSQLNNLINNTDTQVNSANPTNNPNIQILSIPTNMSGLTSPQIPINQQISQQQNPINQINHQQSLINTLNSMNYNQLSSLFSNPQGIFNSLPMNPRAPVAPYSPLMTSYGVYAPNLRKDPTMNAFLNGELYPLDMAEMGVWSALNRELFKKPYSED